STATPATSQQPAATPPAVAKVATQIKAADAATKDLLKEVLGDGPPEASFVGQFQTFTEEKLDAVVGVLSDKKILKDNAEAQELKRDVHDVQAAEAFALVPVGQFFSCGGGDLRYDLDTN